MNKTSISRVNATLVIRRIKAVPGETKSEICEALRITLDQFQSATPYIKGECERVRLGWHVKKLKQE